MEAITNYVQEALADIHQVRWPTRQQAIRLSIIVLGFVAVTSVAFGAVDFMLNELVTLLLSFT